MFSLLYARLIGQLRSTHRTSLPWLPSDAFCEHLRLENVQGGKDQQLPFLTLDNRLDYGMSFYPGSVQYVLTFSMSRTSGLSLTSVDGASLAHFP